VQDCREISRVQFHTDLEQLTKNKIIEFIEMRMNKEEQQELNGIHTGYYDD